MSGRLLVLGGTRFLGRHAVEAALADGWEVTTFTRGLSGEPPPRVRALHGDRTSADDLRALAAAGEWDVVVDTSGYVPSEVGLAASALADRVRHYVFVSSMSVYPDIDTTVTRDDSPTYECDPDEGWAGTDEEFVEHYGRFKIGCERAVERHFPGRCTHVRAGLIIGPYDNAERLPWHVWRIGRVGGEVIGPGDPATALSLIDARDLVAWMLRCGADGVSGAYLGTSPSGQTTWGELFGLLREVSGSDCTVTWVPDEVLLAEDVGRWQELPLWVPMAEAPHTWDHEPTGALRTGLRCRPIRESLADTWAWLSTLDRVPTRPDRPSAGMAPDKERRVLAAWHARANQI